VLPVFLRETSRTSSPFPCHPMPLMVASSQAILGAGWLTAR
jgi:hypothetical protein